jgi:hypothetical protein
LNIEDPENTWDLPADFKKEKLIFSFLNVTFLGTRRLFEKLKIYENINRDF